MYRVIESTRMRIGAGAADALGSVDSSQTLLLSRATRIEGALEDMSGSTLDTSTEKRNATAIDKWDGV